MGAGPDAIGVTEADVDRVLVTHHDEDHVGGLARLTPELDAPVYVHRLDAPYVAGEKLPPWNGRTGLEILHRLFYRRLDLPELRLRRVADGETVGGVHAYHIPEHSPGDVAFVHEFLGAAFLGDLAVEYGGKLRAADRITSYDAGDKSEYPDTTGRRQLRVRLSGPREPDRRRTRGTGRNDRGAPPADRRFVRTANSLAGFNNDRTNGRT